MALTPQQMADLEAAAALMQGRFQSGLGSLQGGTLSPFDPLYNYAKTAPVLSLKGNKEYENLDFQALPNTNYRLTLGGNVIGSASTPEEVARLVDRANAISEKGGKAVDVRLQKEVQTATSTGEPATAFEDVYANKANNNGFLDIALPAALAAISGGTLGPLLGGGMLGTGAAAGLGSIAGSLGTGASLEDALIKGAITGITAGGLSGLSAAAPAVGSKLGSTVGSTVGSNVGSTVGSAVGSSVAPAVGEILVTAARPLLTSALSAGIGGVGGSLLGDIGKSIDPFQQALDQARLENRFGPPPIAGESPMIEVTGTPNTPPAFDAALAGIPAAALGAAPAAPPTTVTAPPEAAAADDEIVVTNTPVNPNAFPVAVPTSNLDYLKDVIQDEIDTINVPGKRPITDRIITGALGVAGLGALANTLGTTSAPATTADKIQTGLTGAGLLADVVGGGGGDGDGTVGGGTGYTVPTGRGRRVLNSLDDDPFTYGQKSGELLFFGNGMAEGGKVYDDMVSHLIEYRKGGGHMGPGHVKGIGSGQDDKIPAWLSDGEYVWSAQDVADLGDGSTDEGVRRLDKMREMVRKGAGRKDVKKIAKPQRGIEDMLKAVGGAV